MKKDQDGSWQVTYHPAGGQPLVTGFGRTLDIAIANMVRDASAAAIRAGELVELLRAGLESE